MREGDADYPSREELSEFLEANRKGGKDAILELLKRQARARKAGVGTEPVNNAPKSTDGSNN